MDMFPIISHTDILFSIFKNRELMKTFNESQLRFLRDCIDLALKDKSIDITEYEKLGN